MPLVLGTKLGPYEIVAPLGAGGMGEVYRARDTRLDRSVAIKILPAQFSSDPVRKQRFEREAKTISSLNHPHICVLHDVGSQDGIDYLVMECVEGESLAKRLERGPLPLEQLLKYGAQIADALDKAHRAGIVHRDLKPGNIMLTSSGARLLDFGLAKPTPASASLATLTGAAPTLHSPVTQEGTIVGTFQYMSPEQVEGKELDGRSDIFSLGAMLYEMLTGRRAFEGKSQLSVASAILEKEPAPISTIKPMTPPTLDHAIRKCLAKETEKRWQSAADLAGELEWIAESGSQPGFVTTSIWERNWRERLIWLGVTAVLGVIAVTFAAGFFHRAPKPLEPIHLTAEIGADVSLDTATASYGSVLALSSDGTHIAFVGRGADQTTRMYIRSLGQRVATVLSGTDGARDPFFSPDGEWIGFFADGKLKKVARDGGAAVTLCDAAKDSGGSWSKDGTIVFSAASSGRSLLFKVPSVGGSPEPFAPLDKQSGELVQVWPQVLPGGKAVLYTSRALSTDFESADLVVYILASGQRKTMEHGAFYGRYVPSGHLLYVHEGSLFAIPFNLSRLEVTDEAKPILEEVAANGVLFGGAQFSFSESGTLAYISGHGEIPKLAIYWMSIDGKFEPLRATPAGYRQPAFSPDGRRLAVEVREGKTSDVWIYDLERDTFTRLAADAGGPVWTPDGQRISYYAASEKGGEPNLYLKRADGVGDAQRLTVSKNYQFPFSWRPDGRTLAFIEFNSNGANWEVMTLSLEGDEKSGWKPNEPKPFVNTPFNNGYPAFSPDGRWLAYGSMESGIYEVYVRPFPGPGGRWQISSGGGTFPKWSRNGKELFYRTRGPDSRIMVVTYSVSGDSFHADKPRLWSPGQFTDLGVFPNFDVHPDGKRFAVLKAPGAEGQNAGQNKVNFIFNFFEELRRKVPSGNN
jgi:Tol biopolymer transport system component